MAINRELDNQIELYLLVGNYVYADGEMNTDWLHVVSDHYPEWDEAVDIFKEHVAEQIGTDVDDIDIFDENLYINKVEKVDSYRVTLSKETL